MNSNSNVSVEAIQDGIDYLQNNFMKPLEANGKNLIDDCKVLSQNLSSTTIDALIAKIEKSLASFNDELISICNKAKGQMDESSKIIQANQESINNNLESF